MPAEKLSCVLLNAGTAVHTRLSLLLPTSNTQAANRSEPAPWKALWYIRTVVKLTWQMAAYLHVLLIIEPDTSTHSLLQWTMVWMCNLVNCKVSDYQLSEVLYEMEWQHAGNQGGMETCLMCWILWIHPGCYLRTSYLEFIAKVSRG